ncbi:MAG: (Fe-S)-binding protein [Planctomycetota bacterium]
MPYLNEVKIIQTMPCIAMPERIRFIAELDMDISKIMPYLNAIMEDAIYNHNAPSITLKRDGRLIGIQAKQLAAGKVVNLKEANELVDWFKNMVNDCYTRKNSITPNYERRKTLLPLDIYKLLPATNCKKCNEPACMAFAIKLISEEKNIMVCADLFSGKYNEKRDELIKLLKSCGYSVPEPFAQNLTTNRNELHEY